jgi:DNA polymerase I-like protein with 3'-5' exonuclease and polymerase domains
MEYPNLLRYPYFSIDTETTGLNFPVHEAFGFSIATPDGRSFYYDLRVDRHAGQWLEDTLSAYGGVVIAHNATFDAKMLLCAGVAPHIALWDDTAIRACLINEHLSTIFPWTKKRPTGYSLDALSLRYLKEVKQSEIYGEMAGLFGGPSTRKAQIGRISEAPPEVVAPYARKDAELTLRLWEWQEGEIQRQKLGPIAQLERRTLPHVFSSETNGIRVDIERAEDAGLKLTLEIDKLQAELNAVVGKPFNVNSSPQIKALFKPQWSPPHKAYITKCGTVCGTTPKGNPSISSDVLRSSSRKEARLIVDIRSILKTRDTFLKKHIIGHAVDGRVFPNINQVAGEDGGTRTGRFSYTDPALQQIPNRNKVTAAIVKPCFLPDEGEVWLDGDMNSFEVRVFAHLVSKYNAALMKLYQLDPNADFHQWVSDLMGVPRNPRAEGGANAKQLNLSMIFNSGRGSIAEQLKLPWEWSEFERDGEVIRYRKPGDQAVQIIDRYHQKIQGVKELANRAQSAAEENGHIRTQHGRVLRFPRGYKSYKASGLLIQATSADINKVNWGVINDAIGSRGRLILNTHDSYSMSVKEDCVQSVWKDVKCAVESAHKLRVPLPLDLNGSGPNWWEAIQ